MDGTVKVMTGMSHTLTGLTADTNYSVRVAACNAVGMSAWSPALVVQTDPASGQSNQQTQPTETPGDGGGDTGGDSDDDVRCGDEDSNRDCYDIVVFGTCSAGEWAGHTHPNTGHYWGSTVNCLDEDLINSIDPAPRTRMWTKSQMHDHKHPGFTDANHSGNSCNAQHVVAHASHTPLSCSQ
jgi:hypothetical protein